MTLPYHRGGPPPPLATRFGSVCVAEKEEEEEEEEERMELETVKEIMACLHEGRTLFHYHKDRYALMLLAWAAGDGCKVEALRRGPFAPLLQKPLVKRVLSGLGKGEVDCKRGRLPLQMQFQLSITSPSFLPTGDVASPFHPKVSTSQHPLISVWEHLEFFIR